MGRYKDWEIERNAYKNIVNGNRREIERFKDDPEEWRRKFYKAHRKEETKWKSWRDVKSPMLFDDSLLNKMVGLVNHIMFTERNVAAALEWSSIVKGYIEEYFTLSYETKVIDGINPIFTDFWSLEKLCQEKGGSVSIIDRMYELWLMESFYNFESYIFYLERYREQEKRFYLPRIEPLNTVLHDLEDLSSRKIKFLGISLPSRTGKALAYDTPVLTKDGWKKHGELEVGDYVIGLDGKFKRVLAVHPPCEMEYKVIFSDKEEIICHGNHEWVVYDRYKPNQEYKVIETNEMIGKETDKDGHKRFRTLYPAVIEGEHKELAVDPYTLGVWLGDGRNSNPDIVMAKEDCPVIADIMKKYQMAWWTEHKETGVMHYGIKGLRQQLQTYGMCHSRKTTTKHIPSEYLSASKEQRLDLLAGLLDTDGTLRAKEHRYCFSTTEPQMRDDFVALVHTFGWRTCVVEYEPKLSSSGIQGRKTVYTVGFNPTEPIPCRLRRKQLNDFSVRKGITIDKIEPVSGVMGNCITVEDGIYLVGNTLKPTHNSTLSLYFLSWLAMKHPDESSAIGSHSGILAKGFYGEVLNIMTSDDYAFGAIYKFWHKTNEVIEDKSSEYLYINLGASSRFATIVFRGIDGTWTGAINISPRGLLVVDDLVRDREHSLSPTRMENTWQEYLNKMVDRKSGADLGDGTFAGACELMIGTLWNVYDPLYRMETLYGDDPLYRFRKIPALNEKDETNFPYQYTTEYLHEMRERLDAPEWMAKWQQAPFVREGLLYQPNELLYFNGECPDGKTIAVLDPAVGGGDNLSMLIIRIAGNKNYIIDWLYSNETKGKTIPAIRLKIVFHNVTELHFERNGIGRAFEEDVTKELHLVNYFRCKSIPFNAPEGMSKEEKILGYSDWVKSNFYFIEEEAKSTTYSRSTDYTRALNDMFIYTTVGKNKHDDSVDNLAQAARMFESQKNGSIDIILNPFR